jgi:thiol-disulfide isomerase/thioredoxin
VQGALRQAVARLPHVIVAALAVACSVPAAPSGRTRPELIHAPVGLTDVTPFVAGEYARAAERQARLLVYVGAPWCEPCRRFHDALSAGELDRTLAGLSVVEFDYDTDHVALEKAGYVSKLIPLFTLSKSDGSASDRQIEGSIKGPSAVAQDLLPRLRALLAAPPHSQ